MTTSSNCDLCGEIRTIFALDVGERALTRCAGCGLVRLDPMPSKEELSEVYDSDEYYTHDRPRLGEGMGSSVRAAVHEVFWGYPSDRSALWRALLRALLRPLRSRALPVPYPGDEPVLDIGCGNGQLLLELQAAGCTRLFGIEPTVGAAEQARRWTNAKIHAGNLETAELAAGHFKLVVMNQVLEHVPSPSDTLRTVRRLLRPDGVLYLTVPNFGAWESSLFGRYWSGLRVPAHLHHFTRTPLLRIIRQAGFEVKLCRTDTVLSITASSLDDWSKAQAGLVMRRLGALPRTAYLPATLVADWLGRGQMLRVVASCA